MIEVPRVCTDPLGDPHTIVERFFPYVPSALEDHSRSYADKYYPLRLQRYMSAQTHINEEREAATNMMAAVAFEKSQKEDTL